MNNDEEDEVEAQPPAKFTGGRIPLDETVSGTADSLEEFNRLLWQLAKAFWIITAMLLGVFTIFVAYRIAEMGVGI